MAKGVPKEGQLKWDAVRLRPGLLARLNALAQEEGLIPTRVEKGQNPVKIGVEELIARWATAAEKKRKRKEGKE